MGNGASSASKQSVPNNGKLASSSKRIGSPIKPESSISAGAAMRAPWGSCILSLHVANLCSKLDFDVSQSNDLGCLHSIAIRCVSEEGSEHLPGAKSLFAAPQRELGVLSGDILRQQGLLFNDTADKLEDFHEFAGTYARIFCNDHIRSTFQRKKSHILVSSLAF